MTERLNTTNATATSTSFSPTSDWSVQAQIDPASKAYIDVETQVDAAAPWIPIGTLSALTNPPVLRFAKVPFARLKAYNNADGYTLMAWSGE